MTSEPYKILLVDDEEMNLRLLLRVLSGSRYELHTALDGREGLERAREIVPDLILLDLLMPELNGIDTCRILKRMEETRQIPIIILTAHPDKSAKLQCLMSGANDFIAKPIDDVELKLRVNNMLEFRRHAETRKLNELLNQSRMALEAKNLELEAALRGIEKAQARIIQQEKMASIGQVAAGVAHEINNPVGYIMSNLSSLKKYFSRMTEFIEIQSEMITDEDFRARLVEQRKARKLDLITRDTASLIRESIEGTERIKKIVQDLKGFSRSGGGEKKAADINAGIESTLNIIWNELKYKVSVTRDLGDLPLIICNIDQLNQVFMNIIMNASHAIDQQGEIGIRTFHDDQSITIVISDTGCGIPRDNLERIFEPFFTTKESGVGTGLGLSISYDIIKKHNGDIRVDSEVGKGTTFTIKIPISE